MADDVDEQEEVEGEDSLGLLLMPLVFLELLLVVDEFNEVLVVRVEEEAAEEGDDAILSFRLPGACLLVAFTVLSSGSGGSCQPATCCCWYDCCASAVCLYDCEELDESTTLP